MKPHTLWTAAEVALLSALYADVRAADIAVRLPGRTTSQVLRKAWALGLKKTRETIARHARESMADPAHPGRATQFQRGIVPWNTGMKGWQAGGRSAETRFKKGELSGRARLLLKSVGAERVNKDGILERKTTTAGRGGQRWKSVHQLIWRAAHGPIPRGHIIVFRDGNKRNFALDNLECISHAENMRRNSYHTRYPKEVGLTIQMLGVLNRKINHATRETT